MCFITFSKGFLLLITAEDSYFGCCIAIKIILLC